jgi:hypothetical protein
VKFISELMTDAWSRWQQDEVDPCNLSHKEEHICCLGQNDYIIAGIHLVFLKIKESGIFLSSESGWKSPYTTQMVLSLYTILGNCRKDWPGS